MGTYFALTVFADECSVAASEIEDLLLGINRRMSTYDPDSELSRFNQTTEVGWIPASAELLEVVQFAFRIWQETEAAFDVTVGPLVELWGFGPASTTALPDPQALQDAMGYVGMDRLEVEQTRWRKSDPRVAVDLSALAKGWAVDQLAALLETSGCRNFLVDIGGEVTARGLNKRGQHWRIGIESPSSGVRRVVQLENLAVATSGDYRNFKETDAGRVHHVIDPRTGKPSNNRVASVTVMHASTIAADAYATALMVLGEQQAFALADELGLAVYMQMRDAESPTGFTERYNEAMQARLLQAP